MPLIAFCRWPVEPMEPVCDAQEGFSIVFFFNAGDFFSQEAFLRVTRIDLKSQSAFGAELVS